MYKKEENNNNNNNNNHHHGANTTSSSSSSWLSLLMEPRLNHLNCTKHKQQSKKMKSNMMMKYFIWIRAWSSSSSLSSSTAPSTPTTIMAPRWLRNHRHHHNHNHNHHHSNPHPYDRHVPIWSYGLYSIILMIMLGLLAINICDAQPPPQLQNPHHIIRNIPYGAMAPHLIPRPLQPQYSVDYPPPHPPLPPAPHLLHPPPQLPNQHPAQPPFLFASFIPQPAPAAPQQAGIANDNVNLRGVDLRGVPVLAGYPPAIGAPPLTYQRFDPNTNFLVESSSSPQESRIYSDVNVGEDDFSTQSPPSLSPLSSASNIVSNQSLDLLNNNNVVRANQPIRPQTRPAANNKNHCSATEFRCLEQPLCIDWSNVGDGVPDCPDASDECPDPLQQFRCKCGQPLCVDRTQVMDGQLNCEDGSDEGLVDQNNFAGCNELIMANNLNGYLPHHHPHHQQMAPRVPQMIMMRPTNGPNNLLVLPQPHSNSDDDSKNSNDNDPNNNGNDEPTQSIPMVMMVTDEDLRLMAQRQNLDHQNNPTNQDNHYTAEDAILLLPENMSDEEDQEEGEETGPMTAATAAAAAETELASNEHQSSPPTSKSTPLLSFPSSASSMYSNGIPLSILSPSPSQTSITSDDMMMMGGESSSNIPTTSTSYTLISSPPTTSSAFASSFQSSKAPPTKASKSSSSSSTLDVVEYTGTFLPYDLLTAPSKYPYYQRGQTTNPSGAGRLTDTKSIVEITGTFIPQMITIRQPEDQLFSSQSGEDEISEMLATKTTEAGRDNTATVTMMTKMVGNDGAGSLVVDKPKMMMPKPKSFKQATNQTFIIGNRRLMILSGIMTSNDESINGGRSSKIDNDNDNTAFIVACAENRITKPSTVDRVCDYVPLKVQNFKPNSNDDSMAGGNIGDVLMVHLASTGKYLIVSRSSSSSSSRPSRSADEMRATSNNKDNEKIMIHAEIELKNNDPKSMDPVRIYSGLGFKLINKIEVNPDRKYVPIYVKDLQPSILDVRFNSTKPIMVPIIVQNDPPAPSSITSMFQIPSSSISSSISDATSSKSSGIISSTPIATISTVPSYLMHTRTVGNPLFNRDDEAKQKSILGSFFPGGSIPKYDPTIVEPEITPSSVGLLENDKATGTESEAPIKATSTIFGFIDFTTTVNGTLLIFTPKSKADVEPSSSRSLPKIEPTKVALFKDFITQTSSSLTVSSDDPNETESKSSTIMNPFSESIFPGSSTNDAFPEYNQLKSAPFEVEELQTNSPEYNEYTLSTTSDDLTITNGFILPSFSAPISSSSILPSTNVVTTTTTPSSGFDESEISSTQSSPTQKLLATTYTTKHTEYITEEIDGKLVTKSNEIISTNVVFNPAPTDATVRPTKPMKTFYTTYTYFTTFKNTETEFVHSRKEVVTNIVDPDELTPTSSQSSSTIDRTAFPAESSSIIMPTSSSELAPELSSTIMASSNAQPTPSLESKLPVLNSNAPKSTKPLNKSYLGKLLSGIAVPITHYTTFTYYTTFFKDSTSQIVSRTNVISNIVTGTINLNSPATIQKRSSGFMTQKPMMMELSPAAAEHLPIIITPVTEFSTSTLYTTFFIPGQGSTVVTNTHLFSNIYLPDVEDIERQRQVTTTRRTDLDNYPFLTTINYPSITPTRTVERLIEPPSSLLPPRAPPSDKIGVTTRLINGVPVLDDHIVLNVEDLNMKQPTVVPYRPSPQSSSLARIEMEGVFDDDQAPPINFDRRVNPQQAIGGQSRRKVVKITKTRRLQGGFDATRLDGSVRRSTVIVRGPPQSQSPSPDIARPDLVRGGADSHYHEVDRSRGSYGRIHASVTPTPVTYYTTYTYFTTQLVDGTPVVRSNEHLFSTVITGKILPTRVVPDAERARRIRRTVMVDSNNNESFEQPVDDNQIDQNGSESVEDQEELRKEKPRKIGVVSEMTNEMAEKTLITQIIGTMINGFYAQFAITKTLDSSPTISASPISAVFVPTKPSSEPPLALSTVSVNQTETKDIEEEDQQPTTEANEIDYSTEMSNNIEDENSSSGDGSDEQEISTTIATTNVVADGVIDPSSSSKPNDDDIHEMMIDDSWMSIEEAPPVLNSSKTILLPSSSSMLMARSMDSVVPMLRSPLKSIEPVYASSSTPTPTSRSTESSSSSSEAMPVFTGISTGSAAKTVTPSESEQDVSSTSIVDYKTGLLSSTVETIFGHKANGVEHLILLTKEVFGTYIGGIYAHLAKTRSETITTTATKDPFIAPNTILSTNFGYGSDLMPAFTTKTHHHSTTTCTTISTCTDSSPHELSSLLSDVDTIDTSSSAIVSSSSSSSAAASAPASSAFSLSSSVADAVGVHEGEQISLATPTIENELIIQSSKLEIAPTTASAIANHNGSSPPMTMVESDQSLWPSLPGLSSISYSTGTLNDSLLVVHTTEFYTTQINGFTAHYSRDTSNIIGTIEPTTTLTKPSIHFPTPVRFLFSSRYATPPITTVTITTTLSSEDLGLANNGQSGGLMIQSESSLLAARKYRPIYANNNGPETNFDDEPSYISSSQTGQMPRSRTIREKDNAQPFMDYDSGADGDVDYADQLDQPVSPPTTTTTTTQRTPISSRNSYLAHRRQQQFGGGAGFGQRVPFGARGGPQAVEDWQRNTPPSMVVQNNRGILPRRRPQHQQQPQQQQQPPPQQHQQQSLQARSSSSGTNSSPIRSMEHFYNDDGGQPTSSQQRGSEDSGTMIGVRRAQSLATTTAGSQNRIVNRNRGRGRGSHHYLASASTTTTTTPLPPRNINLLPSQRLRLNRKYSRNRLPHLHHQQRNQNAHVHNPQPQPHPTPRQDADQTRRFGRGNHHRGRLAPQLQSSIPNPMIQQVTSTVYATEVLPKLPITVTSIATVVKTVPIFHGYRTSYATLTTTTLNTSVIGHSMYETMINEDGMTRTLYTRMTDQIEPNKVTEVLVTTSQLQEVKLVPIKFGYSTRTETLTDIKTFTMLTTLVTTNTNGLLLFSQLLPTIPVSGSSLLYTTTTFVTTQTLSSTTSVSLLLHGKTLVSTLTFTSTTESTVTKTLAIEPTQVAYHQPQPLVTMLTLSIRGDNGEVTELVTAITVPIPPVTPTTIVANKVERDIRPTNIDNGGNGGDNGGGPMIMLDQDDQDQDRLYDDDEEDFGGPVMLESSSNSGMILGTGGGAGVSRHNNPFRAAQHHQQQQQQRFISTSFKTVDSQLISQESNTHPYFITTIFKGPNTEIYEANALLVDNGDPETANHQSAVNDESNVFRKRKLLQYSDNLYKEPQGSGGSVVDNRFTPERTKPNNRKFQRIRIKQSKPLNPQSQSSPANDFHRLVGLEPQQQTNSVNQQFGPESFNSFRRQPLQHPSSDQQQPPPFNLYSSVAISIPPITSTASYLLANNFQKPTYRKIKPNQSRRLVSSIRTVNPTLPVGGGVPIQPTHVLSSRLLIPSTTAFLEVPNHFNQQQHHSTPTLFPRMPQSPPAGPPPDFLSNQRIIQHANRQILPQNKLRNYPVNQFNVPNVLDDQHPHQHHHHHPQQHHHPQHQHSNQNIGQPMMIYETVPNYPAPNNDFVDIPNNDLLLGSIRYSELYRPPSSSVFGATPPLETMVTMPVPSTGSTSSSLVSSTSSSSMSNIHTPTIPLTYYTTFTYLTTVIRGQHTAHLSRESVTSTVQTRALDKSIVEIVRDSDGVIEPTRLQELGTKTKGLATTVYNALYQVQIYNEDLYKVIQKTYNKEVSFKPWQQPTTTAYKPIFVTNNLDEPSKDTMVLVNDPVTPINEFDLIRTTSRSTQEYETTSTAYTTPSYETVHLHTPSRIIGPTMIEPSYQHEPPVINIAEPTPIIDVQPSSSMFSTRPSVRISSSVVRKPYNPRYTHPMSRSRLRMRVSSRTSNHLLSPLSESTVTTMADGAPSLPIESSPSMFVPVSSLISVFEPMKSPSMSSSTQQVVDPTPTMTAPNTASSATNPGFTRPNLFRSKVIFRQRPGQTGQPGMNTKMMRISSRLVRPGSSTTSSPSSTAQHFPEVYSPTAVLPSPTWETSSSFTPIEPPMVDKVDHSDVGRANKFVRVSNGVTLIISSKVATPTRPLTLEPTLVTGAAVMMKNIVPGDHYQPGLEASVMDPSNAVVTSSTSDQSDQIMPSLTTETLEFYRTSTLMSTMTYYATLFNGTASSITPIEDVKTEYITYPDTTVITRTVQPTPHDQTMIGSSISSIFGFHPTDYLTSVPKLTTTTSSSYHLPMITTLKSTYTTLTHYITLFHGSHTILSSIEEISPTVVTETMGQQATKPPAAAVTTVHHQYQSSPINHNMDQSRPSMGGDSSMKQSKPSLFGGLVPSISTLFTTHTYFTTLFSGTTSIIQSREETTHSLITLYVPSNQLNGASHQIKMTTTDLPTGDQSLFESINPSTASSDRPSMTSTSSPTTATTTYYIPDSEEESELIAIGGGSILEPSQMNPTVVMVDDDQPQSSMTTSTLKDGSDAVVYFTNFILPSSVPESENTIDGAKGPLLNHGDLTLINDQQRPTIGQATPSLPSNLVPSNYQPQPPPIVQLEPSNLNIGQSPTLKPGAIIELTDLLDGANLAGNIGEAIKDIVQILAKGQKGKLPAQQQGAAASGGATTANPNDQIDRTSVINPEMMFPPKDGATVSHMDDPVYIPINQQQEPKHGQQPSRTSGVPVEIITGTPTIMFVEPSVVFTSSIIHPQQEAPPPVAYVPGSKHSATEPSLVDVNGGQASAEARPPKSSSTIRLYSSFTPVHFEPGTGSRSVSSSSSTNTNEPIFSTVPAVVHTLYNNNNYVVVGGTDQSSRPSQASTQHESISPDSQTKFITNVEATPSITVMTTTKVYYTRDSPLTITSSYTSTMPLKTVVTTIVGGTKTIMNTYSTEIKPTKSVGHPQSTASVTSITSGGRSREQAQSPFRPTRKPGVNRFKPPVRATEPPKTFKTSHRPRQPYKPSPTMPPELDGELKEAGVGIGRKPTTKFAYPRTTTRPSILDVDQCKPGCNAANKEICREFDGKFKCDCRPGYVKKTGGDVCLELQNFIVLVRVTRLGDQELEWDASLLNHTTELYQNLAKAARNQVDQAYVMINSMKENYVGADVLEIAKANDGHGILVNMTIHLTESNNIDEDLIREELSRTLMMPKPASAQTSSAGGGSTTGTGQEQLPSPQQIYADLEDVVDFDECSSEEYNDCASSARCINEPGSYRCECLNGYPDLDLSFPGRMCASEIKACEFCYGRGDCYRDETGQISSCKCHRMYLGRRCEINGLLLAIFIPVIAILCIITICSIVYCCRKWRNRALVKGFRNFSAYGPNMIGSTLDRKAMLETSSDNSDPMRSHISYDGPGITPGDATLSREYRRRRESEHHTAAAMMEPYADPTLASYPINGGGASSIPYNFNTQFMIPRVRNASSTTLNAAAGGGGERVHHGSRSHHHRHQYVGQAVVSGSGHHNHHHHHHHGQNNGGGGSSGGSGGSHSHHSHHHHHHHPTSHQHHNHHSSSSNYDYGSSGDHHGGANGRGAHSHHQYAAW